jgi:hypothetical protein
LLIIPVTPFDDCRDGERRGRDFVDPPERDPLERREDADRVDRDDGPERFDPADRPPPDEVGRDVRFDDVLARAVRLDGVLARVVRLDGVLAPVGELPFLRDELACRLVPVFV